MLFNEERAYMGTALPRRVAEFTAGRHAARQAMRALGEAPRSVQMYADRSPKWPPGIVGSISHDAQKCVAVVGRSQNWQSLGIDIEPDIPLDADLVPEICTTREQDWLAQQPESDRLRLARLIFCAKECAYKCQYPITRALFGFDALEVAIGVSAFTATFTEQIGPFAAGDVLTGGFTFIDGKMISFMAKSAVEVTSQGIST
ncbi:4'-phosphopantetheinyl transferase superfamily protein [Shimia sp. SDUM112013]|uniref:4'-phosphopantetheinyl transferase family protein n=1 Tax=Shimia sp. SDUM112013 TaxID=3136160 RepID=UPI0032EE13B5